MSITVNDLSPDQREAYDAIVDWMDDARLGRGSTRPGDEEPPDPGEVLTLGGYAGSGKSTLVSLVANRVELPAFCAYTGKASSVLKRKLTAAGKQTSGTQRRSNGSPSNDSRPYCGTIHSLIYRPCDCREPQVVNLLRPCPEKDCVAETTWTPALGANPERSVCGANHVGLVATKKAFDALKPETKFVYAKKNADGSCALCGGKEWLRRELLDRDYGLIIVDEASMVDDTMLRDLRSYGVPILAVGDHGQLPPVGGAGSLMRAPQLRLEKIHRQAEGDPIIALSKMIRETGSLPDSLSGDSVQFARLRFVEQLIEERYGDASPARLLEMGFACYTNRRRVGLNVAIRRARGTARNGRELPRAGEHVVCLRNMKEQSGRPPIYNGMRGVMTSDATPKVIKNARMESVSESEIHLVGHIGFPEDSIEARSYEMLRAQFGREKTFSQPEELQREVGVSSFSRAGALFDYGYAMTVHKMQGSQYDDLAVTVERPGPVSEDDWRRWLYTAVTRAAKKLTVLR